MNAFPLNLNPIAFLQEIGGELLKHLFLQQRSLVFLLFMILRLTIWLLMMLTKPLFFRTFFAKQSSTDDSTHNIPIDNADFNGIPLSSITIMQYEVYDILKTLKQGKASGLTEAAFQLAPILCSLFRIHL